MGLPRKKARTTPPQADETSQNAEQISIKREDGVAKDDVLNAQITRKISKGKVKELKPQASWYGTWPRKSIASTQIARETILADKPANKSSSNLSRFEIKKTSTMENSTEMKEGESVPNGTAEESILGGDFPRSQDTKTVAQDSKPSLMEVSEMPKIPDTQSAQLNQLPLERPVTASGWFGWLGTTAAPNDSCSMDENAQGTTVFGSTLPLALPNAEETPAKPPIEPNTTGEMSRNPGPSGSSWFGRWTTAPPSNLSEAPKEQELINIKEDQKTVLEDAPLLKAEAEPAVVSSWAFWSVDTSNKNISKTREIKDAGQVAIAGEISQDNPRPAAAIAVQDKKGKSAKHGRISTEDERPQKDALLERPLSKSNATTNVAPAKISPPNLILPSVRSTYGLVENPSILQQIGRLLHIGQQPHVKHVFLSKERLRVKKVLAIGIHGLFPAPLLRPVIGQPTGTSIRFVNHAAEAIRRWTDANGSVDCEIEKVALEGEGKIGERVDNLWKLLLNWMDHVRKADFIMIACHSQGVPVAIMLIAKLIEFGVVTNARIGVCAMAGVSLGPFADYKPPFFGGSAAELFDFANPKSTVSIRYIDALRVALKYGTRVTYCGSIDDQLIPMESSVFATASHPYIYRIVFIDGRIHAPDFIAHLVGFALKLRNLGVSDHGLIRELSAPLAGSLYSGEGHSRLYDDEGVYDLAIEYALETTSVGDVPLEIAKYEIPNNSNPYVLPWIMRGLLEEDFVKTELDAETTELLKQFDAWKPTTKMLKDVKYRLEAVRSKL